MISVVIISIIGYSIFTQKEKICGPNIVGLGHDISSCEKTCETDNDCKFSCGCGAISKLEICDTEGIEFDCVLAESNCQEGTCVEGEEFTEKAFCQNAGETWKTFPNGCVDSCELERTPETICTQAFREGCDCGPDKCWNFNKQICEEN